ncbi:MAG: hypothetical protein WKF29_09470 [Thermoleophilaceae bacterium]
MPRVEAKKRCCKSGPRCRRCPVTLDRLSKHGLAKRKGDGTYKVAKKLPKKRLKAARAR